MILLTLPKIYVGQKINDQSLYYFNPQAVENRQIISRINIRMCPSTERVKTITNLRKQHQYRRITEDFIYHSIGAATEVIGLLKELYSSGKVKSEVLRDVLNLNNTETSFCIHSACHLLIFNSFRNTYDN